MLQLGEQHAARISLSGPTTTGLLDDLDPERAGRDQLPFTKEILKVIADRATNWTVVPCPTAAVGATSSSPTCPPDEALDKLWEQVAHVCRLDEPDPVAAWHERADGAEPRPHRALNERRFDALHFEGPGTDLTVGLLPTSTFHAAQDETVGGIVHLANLPTEEVYATPDPQRTDGRVRSTKPLVLADGTIIRGLEVRFEGGRAVEIDAEQGAGVMRGRAAFDDGAARLGEVALVDREGRIGKLGTVFYDTLLDENAASHIALGDGSDRGSRTKTARTRNHSSIHIDFMIGGDDVTRHRPRQDGERVPVLRGRLLAALDRASTAVLAAREHATEHSRRERLHPGEGAIEERHEAFRAGRGRTAERIERAIRSGPITVHSSCFGMTPFCGKPSVSAKPGSTVWTRTPRPRSCAAVARENASCACFDAAYGPDGGIVTAPATETTLTTSDGAAASSAGRNARRHQTLPR